MAAARWHTCRDAAMLAERAAAEILGAAARSCRDRGAFHLVLPGGRTPRDCFVRLRHAPVDWSEWHIWFGDERCLPAGDPDRNDSLARTTWLDHVPIPGDQIHPMAAELGPEAAAQRYASLLAPVSLFDLVLLGLGEDGHTASLFPGHEAGDQPGAPAVLAVQDAPKPPARRVSLSSWRLGRARQVLVLVTGPGKREAAARWQAGDDLPIARLRPAGDLTVLITADALP